MPTNDKQIEEDIRNRFMEAVDIIRNQEGATYKDIMEALDDYQQSYTQMQTGKRYPTVKNIVLICRKYGFYETWLLHGIGEAKRTSAGATLEQRLKSLEMELSLIKNTVKRKGK